MIGSIKGTVEQKSVNYVILETNGIGYKVFLPGNLLAQAKVGSPLTVYTHTYVREDQLTLYGFSSLAELEFFELLLTVSGVGPKSGMGIMSLAELDMVKSAIISEDPSVFTKVSGVGRKTAERVIIELRGKLTTEAKNAPVAKEHTDVLDALVALGYSQQEARDALKSVPTDIKDLQAKVKIALKALNQQR